MSGITDCYQPVEKKLEITRGCLKVLAEFLNPVVLITKNHLVTRDIDLLKELAKHQAVGVCISVTSLKHDLAMTLEPRASSPRMRLQAIRELSEAAIPVAVNVAPVIPGLNDMEIPSILEEAHRAGAISANYTILRLPFAVKDVFVQWLETHVPTKKEKVLGRIREVRQGKLYDASYGTRMRGEGEYAQQISQLFNVTFRKLGFKEGGFDLSTESFRSRQMEWEF